MKKIINLFFILSVFYSGCINNGKRIKKGEYILTGNFINDSIPNGTIKFYDTLGKLQSIKNYKYGFLNGISFFYYPNGNIHNIINFEGGKELGYKLIYDTSGHLIYKTYFYYGKEIGPVYSFDNNNITEYSFNNFEDDILYFCSYDSNTNRYSYPSDKYLIKANTSVVSFNEKEGVNIFLYVFNPPKLKLSYSICYFNNLDNVIKSFPIPQTSFFYQGFFEKTADSLRLGILLNKYDSISNKEVVIIKYLKNSYP